MNEYEFTISLRIRHPHFDPALMTEELGLAPQHTWRAGEARRDPAGAELKGVYRESYWMGRLMEEPQVCSDVLSVESLLVQLLSQLRRGQSMLERLTAEGGVAELHVSLFARAEFKLDLSSQLITALDRLRLGLVFEVQPHPPTSHAPASEKLT
jgi:hypothetical protein